MTVTTPPRKRGGFVRNACVYNHYVNPNRLGPSHKLMQTGDTCSSASKPVQARRFLYFAA
jgi:hypothetical protein